MQFHPGANCLTVKITDQTCLSVIHIGAVTLEEAMKRLQFYRVIYSRFTTLGLNRITVISNIRREPIMAGNNYLHEAPESIEIALVVFYEYSFRHIPSGVTGLCISSSAETS